MIKLVLDCILFLLLLSLLLILFFYLFTSFFSLFLCSSPSLFLCHLGIAYVQLIFNINTNQVGASPPDFLKKKNSKLQVKFSIDWKPILYCSGGTT
jgi:hypothetical protein